LGFNDFSFLGISGWGGGGSSAFDPQENALKLPKRHEILVVVARDLTVLHRDLAGPQISLREFV
jgi:hypothetical protein